MRHFLIACAFAAMASAADYFPPPDGQGGWRTLNAAADIRKVAGMDVSRLDQAFEYCKRTSPHGGLLVVRHGWLVYEKYYGRGARNALADMASCGKSFTSVACGILLKDKRDQLPDGLNTRVFTEKFLPEAFPLDDPRKADITLGQLLSMSAGFHGDRTDPGFVNGVDTGNMTLAPRPPQPLGQDLSALRTPLWTNPGEGYSYATGSPHVASIVLRHAVGMEMQDYLNEKLARPIGSEPWTWFGHREHTPGGGGVMAHATDVLRFLYVLLHNGKWGDQQLVPAEYVALLGRPYHSHSPMGLMFENNAGGHVPGAPRDAYFKDGSGGCAIYVVPSLDMIIYKMAGETRQYDSGASADASRDNWKPLPKDQFNEGPIGTNPGGKRLLEMVAASVIP
jgi:CubicO group peptidase (beta-lactamase class C family)